MNRIAEKNRDIVNSLKAGTAKVVFEADGKRSVKKEAPNTDRQKVRHNIIGTHILYTCPKCGKPLEYHKKMHKNLCMRCGQYLDWRDFENIGCVWIEAKDAEEAGYWAAQYEYFNGTMYTFDADQWRLMKKEYPLLLYFAFPEGTGYGRFMRKAAKEATIIKSF